MRGRDRPLLVAFDGQSGAGKSTLAALVADEVGAAIVQVDDFYAADVSNAEWDARTPAERARDVVNWRRLRSEALEPLRAGKVARWYPFDFYAMRPDGTYPMATEPVTVQPNRIVAIDGFSSSRIEFADLVDLSVLVQAPDDVRRERLVARENVEFMREWHARWDAALAHYFTHVRPPSSFELVVSNG